MGLPTLTIVAASLIAGAQAEPERMLQGTWKAARAHKSGDQLPNEMAQQFMLTFNKNQFNFELAGKSRKGTYVVDTTQSPNVLRFDCDEGWPTSAIFEIKDNELRLCFTENKRQPPTKFESKADTNEVLLLMKRAKD